VHTVAQVGQMAVVLSQRIQDSDEATCRKDKRAVIVSKKKTRLLRNELSLKG
jgi:hypothetical protein